MMNGDFHRQAAMKQGDLFAASPRVPQGFVYRPDFISEAEEQQLVALIEKLSFAEVRMHRLVARRRVAHFGRNYDFQTFKLGDAPPIPDFLLPLRQRAAE